MADLSATATAARDTVGRYFTLVSILPSVLFALWIVVLVRSGAWSGQPDFTGAIASFATISVGQALLLVASTFAIGAVLHPVQFTLVQTLEGYWGTSPLARRLAAVRIGHHRERIRASRLRAAALVDQIDDLEERITRTQELRPYLPIHEELISARITELREEVYRRRAHVNELDRIGAHYPADLGEFLPTRLGNTLRKYERDVGKAYGLEVVVALPYLSRVAAPGDMDYVNDQRSQLDLAVRCTVVAGIATLFTALFLARHGVWLLVALVPYLAMYLSYRGSIVLAAEYGRSLGVLLTLNRFALYERLALPPPPDTVRERQLNDDLDAFLRHVRHEESNLSYRPPKPLTERAEPGD